MKLQQKNLPDVPYEVPYGENAFEIMGGWRKAARKAGWEKADISQVLTQAMSGDYYHLCRTIQDYSNL